MRNRILTCQLLLTLSMTMALLGQEQLLPDAKAVDVASKKIREIFVEEFKTTDAIGRRALSQTMLKAAEDRKYDAPTTYAFMKEALTIAKELCDAENALAIVDLISSKFQIKVVDEKLAALEDCRKSTRQPDQAQQLVTQLIRVCDIALSQDRHDVANTAAQLAQATVALTKNAALAREVTQKVNNVSRLSAEYAKASRFLQMIAAKPDDAAAHLGLGRYLCRVKGDWDAAIPHFAQGSDLALKTTAALELKQPATSDDFATLGMAWAKQKEDARSAYWYAKALSRLDGLEKLRLWKFLDDSGLFDSIEAAYGRGPVAARPVAILKGFDGGNGDGPFRETYYIGKPCVQMLYKYMYFNVDDEWANEWANKSSLLQIEMEMCVQVKGKVWIEGQGCKGGYELPADVWVVKTFTVSDPAFDLRPMRNDFRLVAGEGSFYIHRLSIRRMKMK